MTDTMSTMATPTAAGTQALHRLLIAGETMEGGQVRHIARFLGACWNGARHFDFSSLRAVDRKTANDMLAVLNALSHHVSLAEMVVDADARIEAILEANGMYGAGQTGQAVV
jgi:hypothetical protein